MKPLLFVLVLAVVLLSGCIASSQDGSRTTAPGNEQRCIDLCLSELERGTELTNGPCLSDDALRWNVDDWVCDVAHDPRTDDDNRASNQCIEYRQGEAHHFIEVDEECNLIRSV